MLFSMKTKDLVPITLRCVSCSAEQEILIPCQRGISLGKYLWECFECQRRQQGGKRSNHLKTEGK